MLGEFFVASPEEAAEFMERGAPETLDRVEAKGLSEVSLATLGEILEVGPYDELVARIGDGPQAESGEAGVFSLPEEMRDALATTGDVDAVAERWAGTEELSLDGWEVSDAAEVLRDVATLARRARADGRAVLYWWSL